MLRARNIFHITALVLLLLPVGSFADDTGYEKPDIPDELLQKAERYLERGAKQAEKGAHRAAIAEFEKAVEVSPKIFNARYNIARMYQEMGNNKAAIGQLQLLNGSFPKNIVGYNLLGQVLVSEERRDEAIEQFRKAVSNGEELLKNANLPQAKADIALAYHNLGSHLANKGEYKEAEKYLAKSIEADSGNYFSQYAYGAVLSKLGKFNEAIDALKKAQELNVHFVETDIELAKAYITGKPPNIMSAISALKDAMRKDPKRAEIHQLMGDCYILRGLNEDKTRDADIRQAVSFYRDALDLDKDNQRYQILLARACTLAGEHDQAEKVLKKVDIDTLDAEEKEQVLLVQGHILKSRKEWVKAGAKYEAAATLDPSDIGAGVQAGECYIEGEEPEKAEAILKKTITAMVEAGVRDDDATLQRARKLLESLKQD